VSGPRSRWLLALIFGGLGLLLGGAATAVYAWDANFVARSTRTEGRVVRVEAGSMASRGMHAIVEFQAGDQLVTFTELVGSSIPSRSVGNRVAVLYETSRPSNAMVDSFWNHYLLVVIFGAIGGAFLVAGLVLAAIALRTRG
jgi:hypothetical protein